MRRGKITIGVLCVLLCHFCAADGEIDLKSLILIIRFERINNKKISKSNMTL